mgnify:CR=1 FL=1
MKPIIKKIVIQLEEIHNEIDQKVTPPSRKITVAAVIKNPYAKQYVEDLEELYDLGSEIGGILAEKYDHIAAMTNFVIVPLSFLSGTFFPIEFIPETWRILAWLNPFFHIIDGFRYGFTDHLDGELRAPARAARCMGRLA